MMRFVLFFSLFALFASASACGGDDDGGGDDTPTAAVSPTVTRDPLQAGLASVLLQDEDVPEGLEGSGLNFSDNSQVAGPNQAELERLNTLGRQLGVDLTFVPTDSLADDEPVRGGIQNSASVYTNEDGASQTFRETVDSVRATDWQQSYPDLSEFDVRELDITVGDESIWLRVTGTETCVAQTPMGASPTELPSVTCPAPRTIVDDYVIFRAGRVRSLVKVLSAHPIDADKGTVFTDTVQGWAELVVQRAGEVFPPVS
jgi:hypothetical protein